jgi:molybdopterin-guanine dinucleotide biosynthesis protein A
MGRAKAFLEFEGRPLIARVLDRLSPLCSEILIVANDLDAYAKFGVPVVADLVPGKASLGGIYTGLQVARNSLAVVVGCDMPFLNRNLLQYLVSLAPSYDVVIPRARDRLGRKPYVPPDATEEEKALWQDRPIAKESDLQPMHAVYAKSCLPVIRARLERGDLRAIGFHDAVRVRIVDEKEVEQFDPQHLSFFNMNTPDDWAQAQDLKGTEA